MLDNCQCLRMLQEYMNLGVGDWVYNLWYTGTCVNAKLGLMCLFCENLLIVQVWVDTCRTLHDCMNGDWFRKLSMHGCKGQFLIGLYYRMRNYIYVWFSNIFSVKERLLLCWCHRVMLSPSFFLLSYRLMIG